MDRAYTVLDLTYVDNGFEQHIHPVVLFGGQDVVLVDCGYPGSLELLKEELARRSLGLENVTKLVLTHQDDDHMGAAAEIKAKYPAIRIAASCIEAPYISGERKNLRLQQAEGMQSSLPAEQQEFGMRFCERLRGVKPVSVDEVLSIGEVFDWGGGCEILDTSGHTPGHISIRSLSNDFMITGDAAVIEDRALAVANPAYCLDIARARESLHRLTAYPCRRYVCYHGGILEGRRPPVPV